MSAIVPVTVSVDRTDMTGSPGPLLVKNDRTTGLTLISYREPGLQPRIRSVDSDFFDGDIALSWKWQQTLMPFEVAAREAVSESAARAAIAELVAAVSRLQYLVTVTIGSAAPERWTCQPGTVVPTEDRDYVNLRDRDPAWSVSLPCHPIRTTT